MTYTPITNGTGITGYAYLQRTRDAQQEVMNQDVLLQRQVSAFANKIDDVETAEQLIEDRTLLTVALGAFGLGDDINNGAFLKSILESDLSDSSSLANRLTDKRYLAFAQAFNFAGDSAQIPFSTLSAEFSERFGSLETSDDLLDDPSLLRASLEQFGLEDYSGNTYFLQQVLDSDLRDETSFAYSMGNEKLVEFAEAFDFAARQRESEAARTPLDDVVETYGDVSETITSADDLIADQELLTDALNLFGFDDVYTDDFLTDVLNSDLNDDDSVANQQSDPRWAAFSAAFNFGTPERDEFDAIVVDDMGETVFEAGKLERFSVTAAGNTEPYESAGDFINDFDMRVATLDLLGIPNTVLGRSLASRVLGSDDTVSTSFVNMFPDERYTALANLITVEPPLAERSYPEGFVEAVTQSYLEREFETRVGDSDPDLRIALSLERELDQVVQNATGNDARWYAIIGSTPLQTAFQAAFRLPDSFGSIDVEQQLTILKDRSERFYGTSDVADFLDEDQLSEFRSQFLLQSSIDTGVTTSSASVASLLLSNTF